MLPKINPTSTQAWLLLKKHQKEEMQRVHMKSLFENDPERFKKFSLRFNDILFDYSKNITTLKTMQLLMQLEEECKGKPAIESSFAGEMFKETDNAPQLPT